MEESTTKHTTRKQHMHYYFFFNEKLGTQQHGAFELDSILDSSNTSFCWLRILVFVVILFLVLYYSHNRLVPLLLLLPLLTDRSNPQQLYLIK
jgi:hypothetical protein